ncbi:MAG: glycosyltransferase family 4 protein [Candidatus Moraniibacteriota bacterium]|jgi:glycosyltransferase involved in cell wall biosynthesis
MRIGIDVRCFARGKNTGIEEYSKKALTAIFELDRNNEYILFFNAWKNVDIDFSWATKYENVTVKKYAIPNKLLNLSMWFLNYPRLDKLCGGVDRFFMPNSNFYAVSCSVPLFLTIHDLSFEHFETTFSWKRSFWHFFVNSRLIASCAEHIFVVSEATKVDVCQTYGIDKKKVSVTLNGQSLISGKIDRNALEMIDVKEKYNLPYKFILYFGTIEPRKNIANIIRAYDKLRFENKQITHKLVIAGANGWKSENIYDTANKSKYVNDIIFITDVPEEEKESLYVLASLFIYPSFFEGFGFPPLESLACGTPVIASNTTSLPEVIGKNAIMINPMRPDELKDAMKFSIIDKKISEVLNVGEKQIGETQWKDSSFIFMKCMEM